MNKNYFHTIDALRFFAFLPVFIQHVPGMGVAWYSYFNKWGANGVNFFFVLSGFLIGFLLIQEKIQNNTIDLKRFFIRRSLRIWPLYYLIVLVFFVLPTELINKMGLYNQFGYIHEWIYSFTFSENYKTIAENNLTSITPLSMSWSLCIEEHFYLLFPLLIKYVPSKRIPILLAALLTLSIIVKISFYLFFHYTAFFGTEIISCLDLFAMGALLGYWSACQHTRISSFILSIPKSYKLIFIFVIIPLTFSGENIIPKDHLLHVLYPTIQGVFFMTLIALFIPQNSTLKIASNNILSYFGKISYGLYLFHITIINILYLVFLMIGFQAGNTFLLLILIALSLILTITVSHFSYIIIEKPILRIKEKYFFRPEGIPS